MTMRPRRCWVMASMAFAAGCAGEAAVAPDANAPPANPHGIRLVDVSDRALGGPVYGGGMANDVYAGGSGAAVGDLDGDGDLDLFLARSDASSAIPGGPSTVFWNEGAPGELSFRADDAIMELMRGVSAHGAALGDYDGDGDLDIFVAAVGRDFLLSNQGSRQFVEIADQAGLAGPPDDVSFSAVWADFNDDAQLDLYVVNFVVDVDEFPKSSCSPTCELEPGERWRRGRNRLYLNRGDGSFADVSRASGADLGNASYLAAVVDLDGDPALEILVANDVDFSPDDRDVILDRTDVHSGVPKFAPRIIDTDDRPHFTMGAAFRDLDGDGVLDIYLTDIEENRLLVGVTPDLVDEAARYGIEVGFAPGHGPASSLISWGARFTDLDRDGLPEIFVVNGYFRLEPHETERARAGVQQDALLRCPGPGLAFVDITASAGLPAEPAMDPSPQGRSVVIGDLDLDGDDDFVVTPYGGTYQVLRNDTPRAGHFVRVRLRSNVTAPVPIGAVLEVVTLGGDRRRVALYAGGDVHSQSDDILEIGIGAAAAIERALVHWPSGRVQRIDLLDEFTLDRTLTIVETGSVP